MIRGVFCTKLVSGFAFALSKNLNLIVLIKLVLFQTLFRTVLPAKSDSDVMFCLQIYQRFIIDRSLVY